MPVDTEPLIGGVRVVDQVPGQDEYRAGDGDQSVGKAAALDDGGQQHPQQPGMVVFELPGRASMRAGFFLTRLPLPRFARVRGLRSPATSASSMARPHQGVVGPADELRKLASGQGVVLVEVSG
ncbi:MULTISPECIES: hypothetical protein [unclassified Streptomyces]|uniref:hypothetical protein n=1 Tax=unclassified Streptomyces TaxID=2593676 RepID=UPI003D903676